MKDTEAPKVQWFKKLQEEGYEPSKADLTKQQLNDIRKELNFEKHIEETYGWIHDIAFQLDDGSPRYDVAYQGLRGVLFAMRDRMTPQEVFQFSAQLPLHIRGIFFEGYNLKDKPQKYHVEEFLDRIESAIPSGAYEGKKIFKVVLRLIYEHISKGELKDIHATFPKDLQALWNQVLA